MMENEQRTINRIENSIERCCSDEVSTETEDTQDFLPLSTFFPHLQALIIEKLPLQDVATFDKCSRSSHALCEALASEKFVVKADSVLIEEGEIFLKKKSQTDLVFKLDNCFEEFLQTQELVVMDKLTEEMCEIIKQRMVTKELHLTMSVSCSDTSLNSLLKELQLEKLSITLRWDQTDFPYDTSSIQEVLIFNADSLSKECFVNIKCKQKLTVFDLNCSASTIVERVKKLMQESETLGGSIYCSSPISFVELMLALQQLGSCEPVLVRRCFRNLYTNSWAIKRDPPLKSDLPFLVLSLSSDGNISFSDYNPLLDKPLI